MNVKKTLSGIALSTAIVGAMASAIVVSSASTASAGDCRQVRFQIINESDSRIRVNHVRIVGNDGTWNENLRNRRINAGQSWTSDRRRLNRLDSGATGRFTLRYDFLNAADGRWYDAQAPMVTERCDDGDRIDITVR